MEIDELAEQARGIWGKENLSLSEILIRIGVVYGDLCRYERNAKKDRENHTDEELKKEFGNMIFSMIKFADQLGHNPKECIELAIETQRKNKEILQK